MESKNRTDQQINLKDGRIFGFAEFGKADGFPIIYCHGSQSSRLEIHYDMSFAAANGIRIITIDRPGHGLSDFNPQGSILSFSTDVKELLDHLKIQKFSLAGMSAGAPFALGLAFSFPDLICKTSIISGFAPFNAESKKHLSKEVKVMLGLAKSAPFLLRLMLKIQNAQLAKNPKKALRGFLKIMSEPDQQVLKNPAVMNIIENMFTEAFRNGSKGVLYEISKLLVRDWGFELDQIQVPVTFYQGTDDNNVPHQWAELMQSEIKNSKLRSFSNEGHLIIFQHGEEIFMELKD